MITESGADSIILGMLNRSPTAAPHLVVEAFPEPQAAPDEWEEPIPFDDVSLPDAFPVDWLPKPMADYVAALAENTQTPLEMASILALGVLATAFQSRHNVNVAPGWNENLNLYTVAVARPAERKSAVIAALLAPLYKYQKERVAGEAVLIKQNQAAKAILIKRLQIAEKDAVDGSPDRAMQLSAELAEFEDMHQFQLIADDATPEKLEDIMYRQKGCITVASAEGGVFDAMTGRYDNFNIGPYLKGHCGDTINVQRMTREGFQIDNPRLTLILTIQPHVLHEFTGNKAFRGRGLCARFLFAVCNRRVGSRISNPGSIPEHIKANYEAFISRIMSAPFTGTIITSHEADKQRTRYQDMVEQRLVNEWEHMAEWGGKLVGAAMRIAALIHCAEAPGNPADSSISGDTACKAIGIAEHLGCYARAAYRSMGTDEELADARYLWGRLENTGREEMTQSELFDICKGKFRTVDEMEPAMQKLIDMGYVKRQKKNEGKRGRPTILLKANPLSKNSKNSINR